MDVEIVHRAMASKNWELAVELRGRSFKVKARVIRQWHHELIIINYSVFMFCLSNQKYKLIQI